MPEKTLAEFAATFDRASLQPRLAEAEEQRRMILGKFPRESLAQVEMKDYAVDREDRGTLAWLLARGTPALGDFRGVAFRAVGIHKLKGTGLYRSTLKDAEDAESDWLKLRAGLVKCCDLVLEGQWEAINQVPDALNIPSLRTKLLYLYFPNEVLPIYTSTEVAHFMEALGVSMVAGEGKWSATHNRRLLEHLRSLAALRDWSTLEMVLLLRAWSPMNGSEEPRLFKVAPGENAMFWEECIKQGIIVLGWGNTGDLSQAKSLNEVKEAMDRTGYYDHKATASKKAREVWDFATIKVGDIIAANRGTSQILALGTVVEQGYEYLPEPMLGSEDFRHAIHVEWDTSKAKLIPAQSEWAFVTVQELKGDLKKLIIGPNPDMPPMSTQALNQILYGPPGTGKTFRVIREAAAIIAGQSITDDQAAKTAYDQACAEGRVRLATFHQSFSYEDFIEGIRPMMEEDGKAAFQVRDGIFKEIATEALFACLEKVPALSPSTSISETDLNGTMSKLPRRPGENTITGRVWQIADELSTNDTPATRLAVIDKALAEGINSHTANTQYGHWRKAKGQTRFRSARQVEKSLAESDDDEFVSKTVQSYLELGPASGWQLRADKNFPPYVLIIDEINRGNISRIFGELITLIEDDKREGEANALRVTLPSSREPFTVPPNLYLLGTMNTADKSLALLDVALRRRFEFRELTPDFTACKDLPEEMRTVLKRLNERIELRKDRDHRIGHAFFMGVKNVGDFNRAFVRKVVPLLQEYFFNDIDGARFVLGEIGREGEPGFLRQITAASADAKYQRNRWRWFTDVEPGMDCWSQLRETLGS